MAVKSMTVMKQGTEDFTINDPNNADEFVTSKAWKAGDPCYHEGNLYIFTADHAVNTAWSGNDVRQIKLADEVLTRVSILETDVDDSKTEINETNGYSLFNVSWLRNTVMNDGVTPTTNNYYSTVENIQTLDELTTIINKCEGIYSLYLDVYKSNGTYDTRYSFTNPCVSVPAGVKFRLVIRRTDISVSWDDILPCTFIYNNTGKKQRIEQNAFRQMVINEEPVAFTADWYRGNFQAGEYYPGNKYRIYSGLMKYTEDVYVKAENGYAATIWTYASGAYTQLGNSTIKTFEIPAGTEFRIALRMDTETTEADLDEMKTHIHFIAPKKNIPTYWRSEIDSKIEDIHDAMGDMGLNGEAFVFITDMHWEQNAKHSPALIREIMDRTSINKTILGGDYLVTGQPKEKSVNEFFKVLDMYEYTNRKQYAAFGNHDSNINYTSGTTIDTDKFIPREETQSILLTRLEYENIVYLKPDADCSYYFDNAKTKTRMFILDTGEIDSTNIPTTRIFSAFDELAAAMLATPEGWKIVIFSHELGTGQVHTYVEPMADAYNSRTSYTMDTETYDFTNAQGEVIIFIGGHSHQDGDWTTTGGIPCVLTDTDCMYPLGEGVTATIGTTTEQAFDVVCLDYGDRVAKFIRVGRGSSRTISFRSIS